MQNWKIQQYISCKNGQRGFWGEALGRRQWSVYHRYGQVVFLSCLAKMLLAYAFLQMLNIQTVSLGYQQQI